MRLHSKAMLAVSWAAVVTLCLSSVAYGQPFTEIRIGDRDGTGFGTGAGLLGFSGQPVNVDGLGNLDIGDFLPDLDQDGLVEHFQGDDFDNRSPAEIAGASIGGSGFSDGGSTGSEFTDLSLSQSYDTTFGTPNSFPDPPSTDRNDAVFVFDFSVADTAVDEGQPLFFNIVFGDIGAIPGELRLTFATGPTITQAIQPIDPTTEDGRIQGAFAIVAFEDVFTASAGSFDGFVQVELVTRPQVSDGDPFYGVDFVALGVDPLVAPKAFRGVRIGDRDGFGFGAGLGLLNFEADPINVDGVEVLGLDDFLPDLDQDGLVQNAQGDDFENRGAAEVADTEVSGAGFVDQGSTGSDFTDLALSESYDATFGTPNDFPDPPSSDRNDATFQFDFFVEATDVVIGAPLFFNIIFGDIGNTAGELEITFASAPDITITVPAINPSVEDGLIKGAFVSLDFFDVFTATGSGYDGIVDVLLRTRPGTPFGDPFYSIDYAELGPTSLFEPEPPAPVPALSQRDLALLATLMATVGFLTAGKLRARA